MEYLEDVYFANLNVKCFIGGFFAPDKDRDWSCANARFELNKFYYITKGQCVINIEGQTYMANAGDWFFIPRYAEHSYCKVKGCEFEKYWMHFELFPDEDFFRMMDLPYHINVGENPQVIKLFSSFAAMSEGTLVTDRLMVKSLMFALLSEYIKASKPTGVLIHSKEDARLDRLLCYINENLNHEISNQEMADFLHIHPNHFIRFFKNKVGYTPAKYVKLKRLEKAKALLEDTDLNISEIVEKSGMEDISHFSKVFKAYYSMSPSKYREFCRKEQTDPD